MAKLSFPTSGKIWKPDYLGEYWGDFVNSFSIDLNKKQGKIFPSQSLVRFATLNENQVPKTFLKFANKFWSIGSKVFTNDKLNNDFQQDTSLPILEEPDAVDWEGNLIISDKKEIYRCTKEPNISQTIEGSFENVTTAQHLAQEIEIPCEIKLISKIVIKVRAFADTYVRLEIRRELDGPYLFQEDKFCIGDGNWKEFIFYPNFDKFYPNEKIYLIVYPANNPIDLSTSSTKVLTTDLFKKNGSWVIINKSLYFRIYGSPFSIIRQENADFSLSISPTYGRGQFFKFSDDAVINGIAAKFINTTTPRNIQITCRFYINGIETGSSTTGDISFGQNDIKEITFWEHRFIELKKGDTLEFRFFSNVTSNFSIYYTENSFKEGNFSQNGSRDRDRDLFFRLRILFFNYSFWWTEVLRKKLINTFHPLAILGKTLFVGDGYFLHSVNLADEVTEERLILKPNSTIKWLKTTTRFVALGVEYPDSFSVVIYDPIKESYEEFPIDDGKCVAWVKYDTVYLLTQKGQILYFTGTTFTPLPNIIFPNDEYNVPLPYINGVKGTEEGILFLMPKIKTFYHPAGIYSYDDITNRIFHLFSLSPQSINETSQLYFGALDLEEVGALHQEGNLIVACAKIKTAGADVYGLFTNQPQASILKAQRGFVILPTISAPEIDLLFQKLFLRVFNKNGKATFRYQIETSLLENYPESLTGTWIASNKIQASNLYGFQKGDTLIILSGAGCGLISTITDLNSATNTITIADSVSDASGSIRLTVLNFKEIKEKITEIGDFTKKISFPERTVSLWLRLLICLEDIIELEGITFQYYPTSQIE